MNEGIAALVLQWCLICLVWMGSMDRLLGRIQLSQRHVLAVLAAILVTSYSNWRMTFLPVVVNVGGALVPLLIAAWLWGARIHSQRKSYLAAVVVTLASLLFFLRKLFIWDPVLMVVDEKLVIPLLMAFLVFFSSRRAVDQLFLLFCTIPLFDLCYSLSLRGKLTPLTLGDPYVQDLLWLSLLVWSLGWSVSEAVRRSRLMEALRERHSQR